MLHNPNNIIRYSAWFLTMGPELASLAERHQTKCEEWVGFQWDRNSERKIDVAVFLSYECLDDPVLDEIAGQTLKDEIILQFKDWRKDDQRSFLTLSGSLPPNRSSVSWARSIP